MKSRGVTTTPKARNMRGSPVTSYYDQDRYREFPRERKKILEFAAPLASGSPPMDRTVRGG